MDKPFRKNYYIEGKPADVWAAFLEENTIEDWLASESEMEEREGFEFKWKVDGVRQEGKVIKLVRPNRRIVFDWRKEDWDEDHFARTRLDLYEVNDRTRLDVRVNKIPDTEWDEVYEEWNDTIIPKLEKYLKKKK